jgi:predicted nuclease of predicted toxin-antitoxin system
MTDIFIRIYLDEDVDILVSNLLRSRGFEATTAHQARQLGKTDAEQLEYAVNQKLTILTHNRTDFEDLAREYFQQEKLHYRIIIAVRNPYQEIVQRLLTILNSTTADEMKNQLLYI